MENTDANAMTFWNRGGFKTAHGTLVAYAEACRPEFERVVLTRILLDSEHPDEIYRVLQQKLAALK